MMARKKEGKQEQKFKISSNNFFPPRHISRNPREFAKLSLGNTI
jgi:hypothetical protein